MATQKIRVLIVDDAVVVRRILSDALSTDPDIEVAGVAANGRIALQKIPQINPDVVTMDVEMPEMNGIETLTEIRKDYPKLPVIMFSALTESGGKTTLEALAQGASDYVAKPVNVGSIALAKQTVAEELAPKIKGFYPHLVTESPVARPTVSAALTSAKKTGDAPPKSTRIDVVAIGCSTGGPNALADVIPEIPGDFPVPIVVTQHMPPVFTRLMAERLDSQCPLAVREGEAGASLEPGTVWIAPGNHHMTLAKGTSGVTISLNQNQRENSCRPAVDPMMRSVVEVYRGNVLAVIMTGMGHDGLSGCEAVHDAGGHIIVQDEATSVVWGMPGFVAKAKLAEKEVPLGRMATEIVRMTKQYQ
jgi:two-component system chemotaxis response regulator CheB